MRLSGHLDKYGNEQRCQVCIICIIELQRGKTYILTWAPNEDSNQSSYPHSLIRVFGVRRKNLCILVYPNAPSEDSDQTGRTSPKVDLHVRFLTWFNYYAIAGWWWWWWGGGGGERCVRGVWEGEGGGGNTS